MRTIAPVPPGEMLDEEFLKPLGLTKYRIAKDIGVPLQRREALSEELSQIPRCVLLAA